MIEGIKKYFGTRVISNDIKIALSKFLKGLGVAVGVTALTFLYNWLGSGTLPVEYAAGISLVMVIVDTLRKSLQEYTPGV